VAEDTSSFDYDKLSALPGKERMALFKAQPELKNLYNTEWQRRIDAELNNYAWMTPQEKAQYEKLRASELSQGLTGDNRKYSAEKYLKQLFQQKMDAKKAASMLKVHWAPLKQLESFLQGKVNNKIELSAYLVPNVKSLGQVRWGSENSVGIVLDGHITIGGRGDLGSDQYKMTAGQRGQQKYVSRPGQIDPTLSMDTSKHHEVLVDNWKIKEIVLPANIPPEVDRLIQQYKIPVRRLGNPKGVAEGSGEVSVRKWAAQVRKDHGPDVKFRNRQEGGGAVDSVIAKNSNGETVGVYNRKTGYPTVYEPKQAVAEASLEDRLKKYVRPVVKTTPKIERTTNPAGRTTDHVEWKVTGPLGDVTRFSSKKAAQAHYDSFSKSDMTEDLTTIPGLSETALKDKTDLVAKRKALQDLSRNPGVDQKAVQQRQRDLEKEANAKNLAESLLDEFAPGNGDDEENPLDDYPCYDCGSTIYMHHTRLCDLAEPSAVRDLPAKPGSQHWTGRVPKGLTPIPGLNKGVAEGSLNEFAEKPEDGPGSDDYEDLLFHLAYEIWEDEGQADQAKRKLSLLGWTPEPGDDYTAIVLYKISGNDHRQYTIDEFEEYGQQGVAEGVELMTDAEVYRETLGVLALMATGFAVGAYAKIKDIIKMYNADQIMRALEGYRVSNISAAERQALTKLIAEFKQAMAQRQGEQALAIAKQIKSIATDQTAVAEASFETEPVKLNPGDAVTYQGAPAEVMSVAGNSVTLRHGGTVKSVPATAVSEAVDYAVMVDESVKRVFPARILAENYAAQLQQRRPQATVTVAEQHTTEDLVSNIKDRLGDYLQNVADAVRKDPDLINKIAATDNNLGPAIKTLKTEDGHEIKIHGNEDDGFRISIGNQALKSKFTRMEEAVMATEMYCARRRQRTTESDYLPEA
jgi:hypothetical protein